MLFDQYPSDDVPSQWEQDVAEAYVNEHPLCRPKTSVVRAAAFLSALPLLCGVATACVWQAARSMSISPSLSGWVFHVQTRHTVLTAATTYAVVLLLAVLACSRIIAIGAVQLYQRYAAEPVRRRCRFKPTCSEYSILALRKYGVAVGTYKSLDRLSRCKGDIYRIDCP